MKITYPPKTTASQIVLRNAIVEMVTSSGGIACGELREKINETGEYSLAQFRVAINYLRHAQIIANTYISARAGSALWYFPFSFEAKREIVPASIAPKLKCASIPKSKLSHAAYWLHILSISGDAA